MSGGRRAGAEELHFRMGEIRLFEEKLLDLYREGRLSGTTHTYIGQEATAVAALQFLDPGDMVCSQHRSHGYFLAGGGNARDLFMEILGHADGVCQGVGGSQHLYTPQFLSNGILGGTPAIATGLALAAKLRGQGLVVSFIGDGTLGEGLVYECFNLAALWSLPILFVVENNRYAQTTPVENGVAGSMVARSRAFGIASHEIESNDVLDLTECFASAFDHIRAGSGPWCQVVHTYRLGPHSKGDDFRPETEVSAWRKQDPLALSAIKLGAVASANAEKRAEASVAEAMMMPPEIITLAPGMLGDDSGLLPMDCEPGDGWRRTGAGSWTVTYLQAMFKDLLAEYSDVYLLGEDILDPYGGAFKVYKGLSTTYPDRVLTTPISEAGIVAAANGLALKGFRPVVEIMFGDFFTLAVDQLVNHAAKFRTMFRDATCPTILRAPFGGYRGYGPTHSQSLEKLVLGIPGLVVTACDPVHDPAFIWRRMLGLDGPCVHVENKTLYSQELPDLSQGRWGAFTLISGQGYFPTTRLTLDAAAVRVDAAVVAYGGLVEMALSAARRLFEEDELMVDVVVPSQLAPLPLSDLTRLLAPANAIVVLEEGSERSGFGAEVIAALSCSGALAGRPTARCAARDAVIPANATLERQVLPSAERLVSILRGVCRA